jgi:Gpi18-like mannosyltransferase
MSSKSIRTLIFIWIAWIFILLGFQAWAGLRFQVKHPDYALEWTPIDTALSYKRDKPYLNEPFMNQQVAFDSEYYLSITTVGYADPKVSSGDINGQKVPLNYAFLPLYPYLIRVFAFPIRFLNLAPIATSTLAGVIVSVLGALAGMIALYDLAREELGEQGGLRAAFYLLIFPTGFFLAMMYTEGLFVGLAFGSLALMQRKQWHWAILLSVLATLTRAVGVLLVFPLVIAFARSGQWKQVGMSRSGLKSLALLLLLFAPLLVYLLWRISYLGQMFQLVEANYFGRQFLDPGTLLNGWGRAFLSIFGENHQAAAYNLIEFSATLLGILACIFCFRRYPEVASFSLAVILISMMSIYPQGMHRYVLTAPAVFLFLGRLGKNVAFDRSWATLSTLLMGALALLYAADMWAG